MIILTYLRYAETVICLAALSFLVFKGLWRAYWALGSFLAVRATCNLGMAFLVREGVKMFTRATVYHTYFYVYWVGLTLETVLAVFILYGIVRNTVSPFKGLRRLGTFVFIVAAASLAGLALASMFTSGRSGITSLMETVSQLRRAESLLILGIVLPVLLLMRPMGLSWRSRVFGLALGLGLLAVNDTMWSVWLSSRPSLSAADNFVSGVLLCLVLLGWTAYMALREPERRGIKLAPRSMLTRLDRIGQEITLLGS